MGCLFFTQHWRCECDKIWCSSPLPVCCGRLLVSVRTHIVDVSHCVELHLKKSVFVVYDVCNQARCCMTVGSGTVGPNSGWICVSDPTFNLSCTPHLNSREADWLWNPQKIKTSWKHFLLEVGKMDEQYFKVEIWAIQFPVKVRRAWKNQRCTNANYHADSAKEKSKNIKWEQRGSRDESHDRLLTVQNTPSPKNVSAISESRIS